MTMYFILFFYIYSFIYGGVLSLNLTSPVIHLNLANQFNHRAFGDGANVDGFGQHYLSQHKEPQELSIGGGLITFANPIPSRSGDTSFDNICIQGNDKPHLVYEFSNSTPPIGGLYLLISSSHGPVITNVKILYQDASLSVSRLVIPDWQQEKDLDQVEKWDGLTRPVSNSDTLGGIYSIPVYLDPARTVISIEITIPSQESTLSSPRNNNGAIDLSAATSPSLQRQQGDPFSPSIHLFAITALANSIPMSTTTNDALTTRSAALHMTAARATRRFWNNDTILIPVLLFRLHNVGSVWVDDIILTVTSDLGVKTIYPGKLDHIAPGHVSSLDVGIQIDLDPSYNGATDIQVQVKTIHNTLLLEKSIQLTLVQHSSYQTIKRSLQQHQAPTWYQQAKFGIFIHWGIYSVPAWAPVGKEYAEWYWWQMNHPLDPTFDHHRQRYGRGFAYDDFIPMWQPTAFDPRTWLDLIDASRAKYFVFTSKHHDGFALFDTKVTNRSSVQMHPHRDFVHDLITTSKEHYPHLKRGIYFSLPEWYHPMYHDNDLSDWHGPPFNPYTNQTIPYTGSTPIHDFVNELQLPQFLELVRNYEPDILWCDIGGINNSSMWQADYFNQAIKLNRQVTINDRCGNGVSDFTTLEYQQTSTPPARSWEATMGMDPRSFGFNQATAPEDYTSSKQLIHTLVDTVSMGGNFLLNVGPASNGTIIPTMVDRLHDMGSWLDDYGQSVFDADPYWLITQDDGIRYMMGHNASTFYILVLDRSIFTNNKDTNQLSITTPLPLRPTSTISTLDNTFLSWTTQQDATTGASRWIIDDIPNAILDRGRYVWVFKCFM
ncbi:glycoside hydrolase superfamily [Chlamydoabsidia padenii]|nr:glycoside hydrolase superfamily [Chlamydoabsidia padenii]